MRGRRAPGVGAQFLPEKWADVAIPHRGAFEVRLRSVDPVAVRAALDLRDARATVAKLIDGWRDLEDVRGDTVLYTPATLAEVLADEAIVEAILAGIADKLRYVREMAQRRAERKALA